MTDNKIDKLLNKMTILYAASTANNKQNTITFWLNCLLFLLVLTLGMLHTWAAATSYSMNADGINYLDIGDAYWRGDWQEAINPVWSPLYSWILGGIMRVFRPAPSLEFPLVHVVNLIIFLLAFLCFTIFWKQVGEYRQARLAKGDGKARVSLPDWSFNALGYLLFIWSSLTLIEIWAVTPDMLMSAIVYLAAAILVRARINFPRLQTFLLFGFLLGVGYLSKTVMLPVAFLFLGASLFSTGGVRRVAPRVIAALAVFVLIAGPYIALISKAKGQLTYGESGPITYMRYANHIPYPHWQGEPPGHGFPLHPSRLILENPPIYEFGEPIGGTYPISYNPSYWYEGVQLDYQLSELFPLIISNALVYFDLFFHQLGPIIASLFILFILSYKQQRSFAEMVRNWNLALISILTFALYALVYVEGRYIAVFILLFVADLLANLSLPDEQGYRKLITTASLVMIFFLLGSLAINNLEGYSKLAANTEQQANSQESSHPTWPGEVAEELQQLGIRPGDPVGVIGYAFDSFWARLARVKIVAEMIKEDAIPFWYGDAVMQKKVIEAFQSTGAKAIVAEEVSNDASLKGWHRVGDSNYFIYQLNQ